MKAAIVQEILVVQIYVCFFIEIALALFPYFSRYHVDLTFHVLICLGSSFLLTLLDVKMTVVMS